MDPTKNSIAVPMIPDSGSRLGGWEWDPSEDSGMELIHGPNKSTAHFHQLNIAENVNKHYKTRTQYSLFTILVCRGSHGNRLLPLVCEGDAD